MTAMQQYDVFTNEDMTLAGRALIAALPATLVRCGVTSKADYIERRGALRTRHGGGFHGDQFFDLCDRIAGAPDWYWETLTGLPLNEP